MIITDKAQIKCYELIESDLKLPADATFTRSSVAYLSDGTQVDANTPRFEQGKFGKAIMVEEGTTNLVNVASWNPVKDDSYETIIQTSEMIMGYPVYQATKKNTSTPPTTFYRLSIPNGATFTASIYVNQLQVPVFEAACLIFYRGDLGTLAVVHAPKVTGWQRISVTYTNNKGMDLENVYVYFYPSRNTGEVTLFGAPQLEQKSYATSFIDSTRSAESLTIPTAGVLNPQEGTVECWVYIDDRFINGMASKYAWIWGTKGSPYYPILNLYRDGATKTLRFVSRDANNNQSYIGKLLSQISVGWHYIACTWKSSRLAFLLDGQLVGEVVSPYLPNAVDAQMYIGHNPSVGEQCNSLIDDLRISSRARTDAEILAAYQSGEPLLADEWTAYMLDFDDKVRITAQGQIICNEFIEI